MERYAYSVDVDYILSQNPLIYGLHSFRNLKRPYTLKDEDFYELCNAYMDLYNAPGWDFITYNSRGEAVDAISEVVDLMREELLDTLMEELVNTMEASIPGLIAVDYESKHSAKKVYFTLDGEEVAFAEIYLLKDGFTDDMYSAYEAWEIEVTTGTLGGSNNESIALNTNTDSFAKVVTKLSFILGNSEE